MFNYVSSPPPSPYLKKWKKKNWDKLSANGNCDSWTIDSKAIVVKWRTVWLQWVILSAIGFSSIFVREIIVIFNNSIFFGRIFSL